MKNEGRRKETREKKGLRKIKEQGGRKKRRKTEEEGGRQKGTGICLFFSVCYFLLLARSSALLPTFRLSSMSSTPVDFVSRFVGFQKCNRTFIYSFWGKKVARNGGAKKTFDADKFRSR